MNVNLLISRLISSSDPLEEFKALKNVSHEPWNNKKLKELFSKNIFNLQNQIRKRQRRNSLATMRALLLIDKEVTFDYIRKMGIFRISKYHYDDKVISVLVNDILQNRGIYGINDFDIEYVTNIKNLLILSPEIRKLNSSIVVNLRKKSSVIFKTLLSILNFLFSEGYTNDISKSTNSIHFHSLETLGSSCSFLLKTFLAAGLTPSFGMIDEKMGDGGFYQNLLVSGCKMIEFFNLEIEVDIFGSKVEKQKNNIFIWPKNSIFEKSIRFGYMEMQMQIMIRGQNTAGSRQGYKSMLSIDEAAKQFVKEFNGDLIQLESDPIERYVLKIPATKELFGENALTYEDLMYSYALSIEDFIDPGEVINLPIMNGITVLDILKVQRFFRFIFIAFMEAFENHKAESKDELELLKFRSNLPVIGKDDMWRLMSNITSEEDAEAVLDLISIDANTLANQHFDLQTTPIFCYQNWCIMCPAIISTSNIIRNILSRNSLRLTMRDGIDPMQNRVADALKSQGFLVAIEKNIGTKKEELEVDILALKNGKLFVFECKNSYHPCGSHELQTSYAHIQKAFEQLEKRERLLKTPCFQKRAFQKLDWQSTYIEDVHTCVITGNRLFNGYQEQGHPVRQAHALINLLSSGKAVFFNQEYSLWKKEEFDVSDLVSYLQGNVIIHDIFQSFDPGKFIYSYGKHNVVKNTFFFNPQKMLNILKSRYKDFELEEDMQKQLDSLIPFFEEITS